MKTDEGEDDENLEKRHRIHPALASSGAAVLSVNPLQKHHP